MIGVKQQVIQIVQSLPENVTVDDVMAELYFKMQVDAGLKELDEGKGIPHEEVEKKDVQMAYKIRWSPRAASNFEEICDYILLKQGLKQEQQPFLKIFVFPICYRVVQIT